MLVAASANFPEKARYRESLSLTVGLTVGFRTVAASNPNSGIRFGLDEVFFAIVSVFLAARDTAAARWP